MTYDHQRKDPQTLRRALDYWNSDANVTWEDVAQRFDWSTESAALMALRRFAKRSGLHLRRAAVPVMPETQKRAAYDLACQGVDWKTIAERFDFRGPAEAQRRVVRWACGVAGLPAPARVLQSRG